MPTSAPKSTEQIRVSAHRYTFAPWELAYLERMIDPDIIELRPLSAMPEERHGTVVVQDMSGPCEGALAWWRERDLRARIYLRRVFTGGLPPHGGTRRRRVHVRAEYLEPLARFAILLAAVVCWEKREDPGAADLRAALLRRTRLLTRRRELSESLRAIAADVAVGTLAPGGPECSGVLERRLIADAGIDWLGAGLAGAELTDHVQWDPQSALICSIEANLRAGFTEVRLQDLNEHALIHHLTRQGDPDFTQAELKSLAMDTIAHLPVGDSRRQRLALAVLGLALLAREPAAKFTWHTLDPRHLDTIADLVDMPGELRDAVLEARRFPTSTDLREHHRRYWSAAAAVERQVAAGNPAEAGEAPTTPASPKAPRGQPQEEPAPGFTLDFDDDRRHLRISGRLIPYGRGRRGGQMTKYHKAVRILVDLAMGKRPMELPADVLRDLREGLSKATDDAVMVVRESEHYGLSCPIALSDGVRRAFCAERRQR